MASTLDRRVVVLGLVLLGALVLLPTIGMGVLGYGHMGGGIWGGGMWGDGMWNGAIPVWAFLFAAISQLAFFGLLALGAYLLYRALTGDDRSTDPALEELRVAYARGDLSEEEFERRRDTLQRHDTEREDYQS